MDTGTTKSSSAIANLVQVVLPVTAAVSLPPLLLGWALIQAAGYFR